MATTGQAPMHYHYPPRRPTSGLAIASFVLSLCGVSILGVIFGHVANHRIKRDDLDGRGFAVAGLVLGYICTAGYIILILSIILLAASAGNA